jgi:hypothetical protein
MQAVIYVRDIGVGNECFIREMSYLVSNPMRTQFRGCLLSIKKWYIVARDLLQGAGFAGKFFSQIPPTTLKNDL